MKPIAGDKCLVMLKAVGDVFPEDKYQRCTVHFYRNVFSVTPLSKVMLAAKMLKSIHTQKSKKASQEKTTAVVEELCTMKPKEAAKRYRTALRRGLLIAIFPANTELASTPTMFIEQLTLEIRRRTRVLGSFPAGNSALALVHARYATWLVPSGATI